MISQYFQQFPLNILTSYSGDLSFLRGKPWGVATCINAVGNHAWSERGPYRVFLCAEGNAIAFSREKRRFPKYFWNFLDPQGLPVYRNRSKYIFRCNRESLPTNNTLERS